MAMLKWQGGFQNNLSEAQFDLESHVLFHIMNKGFVQFIESLHKQKKQIEWGFRYELLQSSIINQI